MALITPNRNIDRDPRRLHHPPLSLYGSSWRNHHSVQPPVCSGLSCHALFVELFHFRTQYLFPGGHRCPPSITRTSMPASITIRTPLQAARSNVHVGVGRMWLSLHNRRATRLAARAASTAALALAAGFPHHSGQRGIRPFRCWKHSVCSSEDSSPEPRVAYCVSAKSDLDATDRAVSESIDDLMPSAHFIVQLLSSEELVSFRFGPYRAFVCGRAGL